LEELEFAEPGPGELAVRVRAAAICDTDVLGHEVSGEVMAIGPGVTGFKLGQRVAIAPNIGCGHCPFCISGRVHMCPSLKAIGIQLDGGFAEYVRVPAEGVIHGNVIPLPDSVSFAQAALVEPLACCYNSFEVLRPAPGDYVMIYGAGPIGILHLLLAKMVSPARIILADPLPQRLASAEAFGPDAALDPSRPDLGDLVRAETDGHGPDVTIVACPSPQAQADALTHAAIFGRVCFITNSQVYLNSQTPASHRGRFSAVIPLVSQAGYLAGPWFTGRLIDRSGVAAVWPRTFLLGLAGAALMLALAGWKEARATNQGGWGR
jgi:L-iditol 2-dehydrogenase